MTSEEMEELKGLAASMGLYDDKYPCKRAVILGKAIKILEQEPCYDAISRQAVIDEAFEVDTKEYGRIDVVGVDAIDSLPSVKPQPKTGRWVWVQYDGNPNIGNWHCSECNRIVCGAITAVNPVYAYKYCPNCGARMVEPQAKSEG